MGLISGRALQRAFNLTNPSWNSGVFSLSVPTQTNKTYVLQYKNGLRDPNWISLPVVAGTGQSVILLDPWSTNSIQFYRVLEL